MGIPEKYKVLLNDFIELLKANFKDNLCSAILYGSVAKGTARRDSDIDVCLIFKGLPRSRYKRTLLISPLLQTLREKEGYKTLYNDGYLPEITPILYTVEEMQDTRPIFLDIVEDGIILLDDGTSKKKLQELKQRMEELGTHKVVLENGDYYWVLKPGLRLGEEVTI
jgi:predicted nucleotidyltransferase